MKWLYRPLYNMLTAGETIDTLRRTIRRLEPRRLLPIADYIQEAATTDDDVRKIANEYRQLAAIPELTSIALKPSSFRFNANIIGDLIGEFVAHKKRVFVDAEEAVHHARICDITNTCMKTHNVGDVPHVYKTYQMYRRDSVAALTEDIERIPCLGIKLVRGAYWNQDRQSGELFEVKQDTDAAFRQALQLILKKEPRGLLHAMICTHNPADIQYMIDNNPRDGRIAHASLYGFIENETQRIQAAAIPTYKYLPYGAMDDAIPYLLRRIRENPRVLRYYLM